MSRDLTGGQALSHLQGMRSNAMEIESLEARQVRLGKNQSLFRSVNERVEKISEQQATLGPVDFLCECATPNCGSHIELTHGEYETIRHNPAHFFVLPDHVFPEVENIVDDRGRYVVVEKFGAAGRVASSIDARTATTHADLTT